MDKETKTEAQTNETAYYAGLDIGGTNGRLRICAADGTVLGNWQTPGCMIRAGAEERSRNTYRALLLPALEEQGLKPENCAGICIAASGVDSEPLRALCGSYFAELGVPKEHIAVYNDCEIFLKAYDAPALIVVAGTGAIAFGADENGAMVRTGGWNHILSDEGSGFYIGMQVVKAVGDHLDGRKSDAVLYRLFHEQTGIADLEALNNLVNSSLMTRNAVANLAPLAEQALRAGSEAAKEILDDVVARVFALVEDTLAKMQHGENGAALSIILWGSVLLKNVYVNEQIRNLIAEKLPEAEIFVPEKSAVEIAVETARHSFM